MRDSIRVLDSVLTLAKWAEEALNRLVDARCIDESDTKTFEKVVSDWLEVQVILLDTMTDEERDQERLVLSGGNFQKGQMGRLLRKRFGCEKGKPR